MKIDDFKAETSNGGVSWKQTALNLFNALEETVHREWEVDVDIRCPYCENKLLTNGNEVYCSNEDCKYNPILLDYYINKRRK